MQIVDTNMTVAEYCESLDRKALIVNRKYQRSNRVWPQVAQSFLIETMLLGYPVPKLSLFSKTDRISRKTVREIVDGQQRTVAIKAFYDGDLRLSRKLEHEAAAGRTYEELDDELQSRFLSYSLTIDEFVNAREDDIREVFRRINSYVVALNYEEQRHARWQGDFKWYIYRLSKSLDEILAQFGAFTERQLVRMQDMKLFSEVTHALLYGITTTSKQKLDDLYREKNEHFPNADEFESWIQAAANWLAKFERLANTVLIKPYNIYSLLLAAIHAQADIEPLRAQLGSGGFECTEEDEIEERLLVLVDALEERDEDGDYWEFVEATLSRTNVRDQRLIRTRYFLDAMRSDGGERF